MPDEAWRVNPATVLKAMGVRTDLSSETTCQRGHPFVRGSGRCGECRRLLNRVRDEILRQRYEARVKPVYEPTLDDLVEQQEKDDRWGNHVHGEHLTRPDGWDEDGSGWERAIAQEGRH